MTGAPSDLESYQRVLGTLSLPGFAAKSFDHPFIVALEGPNGAGKTTLSHLMAARLNAPCLLGTDEAWFGRAFKTRMIRDAAWYASAMFFLSGCFEQMRQLQQRVEPLVILDRCLWSTFAVHAAQSAERLEKLITMLRPISAEIPVPHLTLVLEASFTTCQERISKKEGEARALDQLTGTAEFHAREREFYRWLSNQASRVLFLDVERDRPDEVTEKAIDALRVHRC
jgi:thymidylate kinase